MKSFIGNISKRQMGVTKKMRKKKMKRRRKMRSITLAKKKRMKNRTKTKKRRMKKKMRKRNTIIIQRSTNNLERSVESLNLASRTSEKS